MKSVQSPKYEIATELLRVSSSYRFDGGLVSCLSISKHNEYILFISSSSSISGSQLATCFHPFIGGFSFLGNRVSYYSFKSKTTLIISRTSFPSFVTNFVIKICKFCRYLRQNYCYFLTLYFRKKSYVKHIDRS